MVNARWMKILEEECSRWSYILSWKSIEGRFYIRFTLQGTSSHSVHQPNIPFLGTPLISALFMWSIEEYEICLMLNLVEYSYTLWNFLLRWAHATCPPAFDDGYNDIHSLGWNDFQEPADFAAPPGEPDGLDRPIRVAEYDGGSDKLRRRCFSSSLPHCWTGGGEIKETAPPPPPKFLRLLAAFVDLVGRKGMPGKTVTSLPHLPYMDACICICHLCACVCTFMYVWM